MSLFKHHSFEIESIESLMRRGIKIHVNVTGAQLEETGMMSECSLSLQGKSTDISLRISESLSSHDNKIHNFKGNTVIHFLVSLGKFHICYPTTYLSDLFPRNEAQGYSDDKLFHTATIVAL
jgi:hypothetical protein